MAATIEKPIRIHFKENNYSADLIARQSGSGPMIEISSDELHDNIVLAVHSYGECSEEMMMRNPPVFAKYEGKYVVLLGLRTVMDLARQPGRTGPVMLKGRLLSNPMLKRCLA